MKKLPLFFVFIIVQLTLESQTYNAGFHFIYLTTDSMEAYYKKNDNIIKQKSYKINNNTTSSKLSYSNDNFATGTLILDFFNDTSISIYRWAIADKIEQKADSLKSIISSGNVEKYSELLDSMTYYISDNFSDDTTGAELFQVLFYSTSIIKSIKRYNEGADSCYCTSYAGYVGGGTSFYCTQDIIVDVEEFLKYLEDNIEAIQEYDAEYLITYIEGYEGFRISYASIIKVIFQEEGGVDSPPIYRAGLCGAISGGDCGCCFNYQGPCIVCSVNCLVHDFLCQKCKPWWFCGPGCKKTPCY